jgi:hypothetical protein
MVLSIRAARRAAPRVRVDSEIDQAMLGELKG